MTSNPSISTVQSMCVCLTIIVYQRLGAFASTVSGVIHTHTHMCVCLAITRLCRAKGITGRYRVVHATNEKCTVWNGGAIERKIYKCACAGSVGFGYM